VTEPMAFTIDGVRTEVVFGAPPGPPPSLTVLDETTQRLFGAAAEERIVLGPGERFKTWDSVSAILERCVALRLGRDATLMAVGGGVVCDVTAFAASLYMRGCGLVLAPTTLLAMVDASLGGKTGIDFLGYKNMVGSFYPASRIVIRVETLATLPAREYLSGLAEVIKTAIIGDAALLLLLEERRDEILARDTAVVEEMIRRSLAVKGRLVEEDPRERGRRALLNLGHTFGHALESATGFSGWTHGEAVAWGIGRALAAGVRFGMTVPDFDRRVETLLRAYGFRLRSDVPYAALVPGLDRDKKRRGGAARLVIPCDVCDVRIREATAEDIAAVLHDVDDHEIEQRVKA